MYQTHNPYTGQDLRVVMPSPYATLGLGASRMASRAAGTPEFQRAIRRLGRRGMRGLGDNGDVPDVVPTDSGTIDFSTLPGVVLATNYSNDIVPVSSVNVAAPGSIQSGSNTYNPSNPLNWLDTSASAAGTDLSTLLSTITAQAGSIAKLVLTPGGSYTVTSPNGTTTSYQGTGVASTVGGITSSLSSVSPIVWLALAGLVVFAMMEHH